MLLTAGWPYQASLISDRRVPSGRLGHAPTVPIGDDVRPLPAHLDSQHVAGSSEFAYEDLFDIENRPSAGVRLWARVAETQFARVVDANYRHRRNHEPDAPEGNKDKSAEHELHADIYFLALATRNVLRYHDAIAAQLVDRRLAGARETFLAAAPYAKDFRDFYEHLDEYVLGRGRQQKRGAIDGRISPILRSRWDCDNVVVCFGDLEMDITLAGKAAAALGRATAEVWEGHLTGARETSEPPDPNDGVLRMLEVTSSVSTIIGGQDEGYQVSTGVLRDVRVREATAAEVAEHAARNTDNSELPDPA